MAIEQPPPERNLQGPRKHRRDVKALLWVCGWGGAAAVALAVLAITSQTEICKRTSAAHLRQHRAGCRRADAATHRPAGVGHAAYCRSGARSNR